MKIPKLIIHGGAGSLEGYVSKKEDLRKSLKEICKLTYQKLLQFDAYNAVLFGICQLENNPLFNAGTGSKLQNDGRIRMSAGIMDGEKNRFSGVINIQNVKNPILVADKLQSEKHTIIAGDKATQVARDLGFQKYNPLVEKRWEEHLKKQKGKTGTVGVVALDKSGNIVAGTSTGGIGGEIPGRVSDSPTVAGNYATKFAGISATGIGEQIVNSGMAVKIATRVEDGMSLKLAVNKSINDAKILNYEFGVISISHIGDICVDKTTDSIFYAWFDGENLEVF
jgi:L-asparaginase